MKKELFELEVSEPMPPSDFVAHVDSLLGQMLPAIFSLTFYSATTSTDLPLILEKAFSCSIIWHTTEATYFSIRSKSKSSRNKGDAGHCFMYSAPPFSNIYTVYFIGSSYLFAHLHSALLNSAPRITLPFLPQSTQRDILLNFAAHNNLGSIRISRISERIRSTKDASNSFPQIRWPNISLNEAFDIADMYDAWFNTILLNVNSAYGRSYKISFSRNGAVKTSWNFSDVAASLVSPIEKYIANRSILLSDRERPARDDKSVSPLQISFEDNVLSSIEDNSVFIKSLRNYKKASVSIIHGNPYLHISIVDYHDGGVYDIFSFGTSKVTIVPQMRASIYSLNRLIGYIFDSFAEGTLDERK